MTRIVLVPRSHLCTGIRGTGNAPARLRLSFLKNIRIPNSTGTIPLTETIRQSIIFIPDARLRHQYSALQSLQFINSNKVSSFYLFFMQVLHILSRILISRFLLSICGCSENAYLLLFDNRSHSNAK